MDLAQRVSLLESVHDWNTLAEELQQVIDSGADATQKAAAHLRLGRLLDEKFLQGVKALKHFQDAFKLNPALAEALESARAIYWELGKTNMVQKLLDLQLKSIEGPASVPLLIELGDVLADAGDIDRATATYARALGASNGESEAARAGLEDTQVDAGSWTERVGALVNDAQLQAGSEASRLYLRAARIARRFDASAVEGLLNSAYSAQPLDRQAAAAYEGAMVSADRAQHLAEVQRSFLENLTPRPPRCGGLSPR